MAATMRPTLSLLILILAAPPAAAAPEIAEDTITYDVEGETVADIRAAMTANSPESFWGFTRWYVSWTAQCEVSVKITYTLPNWTDHDDADEELQQYWNTFIANLEMHEQGHGNNGRSAGAEIEATGCVEDPYGIIEKWAEEDKTYDDETDHGVTQGAVF